MKLPIAKIFVSVVCVSWIVLCWSSPVKSMLAADNTSLDCTFPFDLPEGVVPVEYIESTGQQKINTGVFVSSDDNTTATFTLQFTRTDIRQVFGFTAASFGYFGCSSRQGKYEMGNALIGQAGGRDSIRFSISRSADKSFHEWWLNGSLVRIVPLASFPTGTWNLFSLASVSSIACHMRLFHCSISLNDVVQRELVPVRTDFPDQEPVAGLYDLISGDLLLNSTDSPLLYGPDL